MTFASFSGDIVTSGEDLTTLDLAVVAPPDDPVWSGIHELHLVNDHPDGGDQVYVGDSVQIEQSGEADGNQLGTIRMELPTDQGDFGLTTVRLMVDEGGTLADHDVGEVSVRHFPDYLEDAAPSITPVGDYPGVLSSCGDLEFTVSEDDPPAPGTTSGIMGVTANAPGMRFDEVEFEQHDDNTTTVSLTLDCDDDYDHFAFSPRLMVEKESTEDNISDSSYQVPLPVIRVERNDLTEENLERIAE